MRKRKTHYNYFRDYDPATGRYLQSDKLDQFGITRDPQLLMLGYHDLGWFEYDGEIYYDHESSSSRGLNHLYGYANQNPLYWIDPYGLEISYWSGRESSTFGDTFSRPNGNMWDGFKPQDGRCSVPGFGCKMDQDPDTLDRCIKHDKCYDKNKCNWSSWISSATGGTKDCNQCNSNF